MGGAITDLLTVALIAGAGVFLIELLVPGESRLPGGMAGEGPSLAGEPLTGRGRTHDGNSR
jgi:hypothetical protein